MAAAGSGVFEVVERCRFWGKDRAHDAELVTDWVLHDHPRSVVALADIDTPSTESFQTTDFVFL